MPVVKVNMTGVDPKESLQSDFNPVPPGMHRCRIISIDTGYAKGDDKKPDKSRPMLTVVMRPVEGRYSQLWYYLSFSDHSFTRKKMDQFMLAIGVLTTTKREASFNTDKYKGTIVICNIQDEQESKKLENQKGTYRPRVVDVFADSDDNDDLDLNADGEMDTEFNEEDFDEDEGTEEEDEGSDLLTREDMEAMDVAALKAALKEYDVTTKTRTAATLVDMLAKAQSAYCAENELDDPLHPEDPEDDEEDEEDEEFEDDEETEEDEDTSDYLTEDQLKAMDVDAFKATAKDFDIKLTGKKRSQVIKEILEAQAAPDDDDEEEPF